MAVAIGVLAVALGGGVVPEGVSWYRGEREMISCPSYYAPPTYNINKSSSSTISLTAT